MSIALNQNYSQQNIAESQDKIYTLSYQNSSIYEQMKRVLDTWSTENTESQIQQQLTSRQNGYNEYAQNQKGKVNDSINQQSTTINSKEYYNTPFRNGMQNNRSQKHVDAPILELPQSLQNPQSTSNSQIDEQEDIDQFNNLNTAENGSRNSKDRIKALLRDHTVKDMHKQSFTDLHSTQFNLKNNSLINENRPASQQANIDQNLGKTQNWYANKLISNQPTKNYLHNPNSLQSQKSQKAGTIDKLKSILMTNNRSKSLSRSKSRKSQAEEIVQEDQQQLDKIYSQRNTFNLNGWLKVKQKVNSQGQHQNVESNVQQNQVDSPEQNIQIIVNKKQVGFNINCEESGSNSSTSSMCSQLNFPEKARNSEAFSTAKENSYSSIKANNFSRKSDAQSTQPKTQQLRDSLDEQSGVLQKLHQVVNSEPLTTDQIEKSEEDQLLSPKQDSTKYQIPKDSNYLKEFQQSKIQQLQWTYCVPKQNETNSTQEMQKNIQDSQKMSKQTQQKALDSNKLSAENIAIMLQEEKQMSRSRSDTPRNLESRVNKQSLLQDNPLFDPDSSYRSNNKLQQERPKYKKLVDSTKSMFDVPCTYQNNPLYDSYRDIRQNKVEQDTNQKQEKDMQQLIEQLSNDNESISMGTQDIDVEQIQKQVLQNRNKKGSTNLNSLNPQTRLCEQSGLNQDKLIQNQALNFDEQLQKQISLSKVIGHIQETFSRESKLGSNQQNKMATVQKSLQKINQEVENSQGSATSLQDNVSQKKVEEINTQKGDSIMQSQQLNISDHDLVINKLQTQQPHEQLIVYSLETDKVKMLNERNKKQAKTLSKVLPQLRDLTQQAMIMYYLDHQYYLVQEDFQEAQLVQ